MKKIIIANWKMNPASAKEAENILNGIKKTAVKLKKTQAVICPPFIYFENSRKIIGETANLFLGAQNSFWQNEGAFTGETSPEMIKNSGGSYVILGHSERRALGETDEMVARKTSFCLKMGLKTVVCVGEKVRDEQGDYLVFLRDELRASLNKIQKKFLKNLIIAYEPIWAIGKKDADAMPPSDIHGTAIYIKKILSEIYGRENASSAPILYGGSAGKENAGEIIKNGGVDGLLVGHQSLNPEIFSEMLISAENI
ncbi:MAG: triose-phosphate isomerase [Patescibacteria group bacterium]|nr:triose-phosphate isomerase [Patescibacteria group bacterium]MDE1988143.1 triose-phosphate isomerase [Patescibacteria group bacterium]MDE2217997.1 triose-phosphate isomerase [Patescibacteria group bacterium]